MISFEHELLGSREFSLIPPNGLHVVISATLGHFFPPSLWWHMLGSRVGLVISPRVGRRK